LVASDYDRDDGEVFRRFNAYPELKQLFEGDLAHPTHSEKQRNELASRFAAVAWTAGELAEAGRIYGAIKEPARWESWTWGSSEQEMRELHAMTQAPPAIAERFFSTEGMRQRGRLTPALEAFEALLSELPADAPQRRTIKSRIVNIRATVDFNDGKTVNLLPTDADLLGWTVLYGEWSRNPDDGRFQYRSEHFGAHANFTTDFGPRYELRAKFQTDGLRGQDFGGVTIHSHKLYSEVQIDLSPVPKIASSSIGDGKFRSVPAPSLKRDMDIQVIVWDQYFWLSVNGQKILEAESISEGLTPGGFVGLQGARTWPKIIGRYSELTIRKITDPPAVLPEREVVQPFIIPEIKVAPPPGDV
jgi:hypothetical protein